MKRAYRFILASTLVALVSPSFAAVVKQVTAITFDVNQIFDTQTFDLPASIATASLQLSFDATTGNLTAGFDGNGPVGGRTFSPLLVASGFGTSQASVFGQSSFATVSLNDNVSGDNAVGPGGSDDFSDPTASVPGKWFVNSPLGQGRLEVNGGTLRYHTGGQTPTFQDFESWTWIVNNLTQTGTFQIDVNMPTLNLGVGQTVFYGVQATQLANVDPRQNIALYVSETGVVPEPSTYGFMLAGLGLMGWLARGRARRQRGASMH